MSTERGKSPKNLWISGILDGNRSGQFGVRNIICSREETEIYGVELSANTFDLFDHDNVSDEANDEADVTDVDLGLSEEQKQHLRELSNPNESFNDYGISLYLKIREEIKQFLNVWFFKYWTKIRNKNNHFFKEDNFKRGIFMFCNICATDIT